MLEGIIDKFTKVETEPVGFDQAGFSTEKNSRHGVKFVYSPHYSGLLGGDGLFHAIYFGDTPSGTHKDGLAEIMLSYAEKRKHKYVAVVSSGSYSIALHDKILRNHKGMQLFELVNEESLKGSSKKKGYSIEKIATDSFRQPYTRVRIGAPLKKNVLSKRQIEDTVKRRVKGSKELQHALGIDLGLFGSIPVLDVTNPHDTIHTNEPFYDFDPALLAQYSHIIVPGGTLNIAYSLQCSLEKIDADKRPNLIVVVPQNHPLISGEGDLEESVDVKSFPKLETPCLSRTAELFLRKFNREKDCLYAPSRKHIRDTYTETTNMSRKTTRHHRFYLVDYQSVYVKKLFRRAEHNGFETKRGGTKKPEIEISGCAALTVINPRFRELAEKERRKGEVENGHYDGLLVPNIYYANYGSEAKESFFRRDVSDMLIQDGSSVLGIITGQSKGVGHIKKLARRTRLNR